MLNHLNLVRSELYEHSGAKYVIAVYSGQDGFRGYISTVGVGGWIAEMRRDVASDLRATTGGDPAETIVNAIKSDIVQGNFSTAQ